MSDAVMWHEVTWQSLLYITNSVFALLSNAYSWNSIQKWIEPYDKGVFRLVLGRNKLTMAAKTSRETTSSNGMAGVVYPKAPKEKVPMIAPMRAINKCIPMAVDLKLKEKGKEGINLDHMMLYPDCTCCTTTMFNYVREGALSRSPCEVIEWIWSMQ